MHCAQAHTIIQSWFNVEDAAENETCRRMELQKMLQQRMKLLENGIAEDAAAANEIAGEWNCREKGIAEDATEENGTDT